MAQHANRLAHSASPYLRQHAHQTVDWYPWGEEALAAARERDVPLLISIGYAACHWCHVMSHESFDDPATAARMNASFVSVKVDREERPDIDAVYMSAVQALTGSGGWPMTVVATPDGRPWFAGTYFPPSDRHGLPGFPRLLDALADAWRERRDEVVASAAQITEHLGTLATPLRGDHASPGADEAALAALRRSFDDAHGGFGGAPKFPPHTALRWLLEGVDGGTGGPSGAHMAHHTLRRMTDGGLHDQFLGGFARYSVDERWAVPHFEKMLYDNALLLPLLARGAARWDDDRLGVAARGVLRWALDDMRPDGIAFAASLDADSEGEEGRFATFTPAEIAPALSDPDDRALAQAIYGIDEVGRFEGRSVPVWNGLDHPRVAPLLAALGSDPPEVHARLERVRAALTALRRERVQPALDDKVVTSWNAWMVRGLSEAAPWLDERGAARAREAALDCADALWERAWDGRRLHHLAPAAADAPRGPALLEDAASYALAALALHRDSGEPRFLARALTLTDVVERDYGDGAGGFFTTAHDAEALVVRPRSTLDGPTPSEYGMVAELLAWVAAWTGDEERAARARTLAGSAVALAERAPSAVASLLGARRRLDAPPVEVLVAGPAGARETDDLLRVAAREAPDHAVVGRVPADGDPLHEVVPWFAGRPSDRPSAYVCRSGTCLRPVHDAGALADALRALRIELGTAPRP